jgi:hypothetical protein
MAFDHDEAHRMIEEALASSFAAGGTKGAVWAKQAHTHTEAANAISRAYAGEDAPDEPLTSLTWPTSDPPEE